MRAGRRHGATGRLLHTAVDDTLWETSSDAYQAPCSAKLIAAANLKWMG
jgi:hypothetical protein